MQQCKYRYSPNTDTVHQRRRGRLLLTFRSVQHTEAVNAVKRIVLRAVFTIDTAVARAGAGKLLMYLGRYGSGGRRGFETTNLI